MRRYSESDLGRVARIRELQILLGLNLEEIAVVLRGEDRLVEIRHAFQEGDPDRDTRRALLSEGLALHRTLRDTVRSKRAALDTFLEDLDGRIARVEALLAETDS
jgi:DNA-binding transcriptional MerR regulator